MINYLKIQYLNEKDIYYFLRDKISIRYTLAYFVAVENVYASVT